MNISHRQYMRNKQELMRIQLDEEWKSWKPDPASGYIKQKPITKSWKIKALKELNKPIIPKPDKYFWFNKFFPNCEVKELPLQERVNKFWINKRRGV